LDVFDDRLFPTFECVVVGVKGSADAMDVLAAS
jgi:hypothetical protein